MARSKYIYFVRNKQFGDLLGAFTVKHEAHTWAKKWCGKTYPLHKLQLQRMEDGIHSERGIKDIENIPWPSEDEHAP